MAKSTQAKLFDNMAQETSGYSAKDIEVLEGLEPVRKRPGMYIGCLLYTSPSPRDQRGSRMPSSA